MSDVRDPDPLNPSDVDEAYSLGFQDGWTSTKPRSLSAPLALGLIAGAFLAGFIVHAALAASRPAPVIPAVRVETAGREPDRGRTEAPRTASAGSRTGASPSAAASRVRPSATPRPKPPKVTAGTVRGTASFMDPKYGRFYLALPNGRGHRVLICGPAACVTRVSTDAGPDLAMQRAGRVADVSFADFATICGCDPWSKGLVRVSVGAVQ